MRTNLVIIIFYDFKVVSKGVCVCVFTTRLLTPWLFGLIGLVGSRILLSLCVRDERSVIVNMLKNKMVGAAAGNV